MITRFTFLFLLSFSFLFCTNAEGETSSETVPPSAELSPAPGAEAPVQEAENGVIYLETNTGDGIGVGAPIEELVTAGKLKKDILQTGEGDFDIWTIQHEEHGEIGYVMEDFQRVGTIGVIHFTSEKIRTVRGLGVGTSWAEVKNVYPSIVAHGSEIEGYTSAEAGDYVFELDARHWSYEIDQEKITPETKVTALLVMAP